MPDSYDPGNPYLTAWLSIIANINDSPTVHPHLNAAINQIAALAHALRRHKTEEYTRGDIHQIATTTVANAKSRTVHNDEVVALYKAYPPHIHNLQQIKVIIDCHMLQTTEGPQ